MSWQFAPETRCERRARPEDIRGGGRGARASVPVRSARRSVPGRQVSNPDSSEAAARAPPCDSELARPRSTPSLRSMASGMAPLARPVLPRGGMRYPPLAPALRRLRRSPRPVVAAVFCIAGGGVRFQGEVIHPERGTYLDRTTLEPLAPERVHQVIEIPADGAKTWRPVFDALYVRPARRVRRDSASLRIDADEEPAPAGAPVPRVAGQGPLHPRDISPSTRTSTGGSR